jgi:hypothetical protein
MPVVTNHADATGTLLLTNTPDSTTNNFWRICSVTGGPHCLDHETQKLS